MRIALAGTGRVGVRFLQAILESDHDVVALLQNGRATRSRTARWALPTLAAGLASRSSVMGIARAHKVPILWLDKLNDAELAPLRELEPDIILVGAFSVIFKRSILDLPRIGCINCHPSLLPRHRGPVPHSWVILNDDTESGVTFHRMDEGIDTGELLDQESFPVRPDDTALTLSARAADIAGQRIVALLDRIEAEGVRGTPQDTAAATYEQRVPDDVLRIRWDQPAAEIHRIVRACAMSPYARFLFRGHPVFLTRASYNLEPVDAAPGTILSTGHPLRVATGQGTLHIEMALATRPLPCTWPSAVSRPRPGDRLE